jgi:hypothetical protein
MCKLAKYDVPKLVNIPKERCLGWTVDTFPFPVCGLTLEEYRPTGYGVTVGRKLYSDFQ